MNSLGLGAGRVWQHACMCIVAVVAHGASLAIKVSIPPVVSIRVVDRIRRSDLAAACRGLSRPIRIYFLHSHFNLL